MDSSSGPYAVGSRGHLPGTRGYWYFMATPESPRLYCWATNFSQGLGPFAASIPYSPWGCIPHCRNQLEPIQYYYGKFRGHGPQPIPYKRLEKRLEPLVNQDQWKRDKSYLCHEDRIVVPSDRVPVLKWTHESSGHVGADLTLRLFKQSFHTTWTDDQLRKTLQPIVDKCPCRSCKPGDIEAVPRTPWPGYGIQPVSGPLTPCTACSVP